MCSGSGSVSGEARGVIDHDVAHVPRVGIEQSHLHAARLDDTRMRVADVRHVVVGVDEAAPLVVEQVLLPSTNDTHGPLVARANARSHEHRPLGRQCRGRHLGQRKAPFGNPDEQIGIWTYQCPPLPQDWRSDAWEIGAQPHQVRDDLDVQVRRPSAVYLGSPQRRHTSAPRDRLADRQSNERVPAQMPIEREELDPRLRRVPQDDDRPIVQRATIVRESVDDAIERRVDRRAGVRKEVDAQMDRAPFDPIAVVPDSSGERGRAVEQSRFVVAADTERDVRCLHGRGDAPGESRFLVHAWVPADHRRADTEVEHETGFRPQIDVEHRREARGVSLEPLAHGLCPRSHACRPSQACLGVLERNGREHRQQPADRPLADIEVRIARVFAPLAGGDAGARAQAHCDQAEQGAVFVITERTDGFVSSHERFDGAERIVRPEGHVRRGDREVANRVAVYHVAEIDNAGNGRSVPPGPAHENVVVVEVPVYGAPHEPGQQRRRVPIELGREMVDRGHDVVAREPSPFGDDRLPGLCQVPVEVAMNRRVIEPVEGAAQLSHRATQVGEKRERPVGHRCKRSSWKVRDQPDEVTCRLSGRTRAGLRWFIDHLRHFSARRRVDESWVERGAGAQVLDHPAPARRAVPDLPGGSQSSERPGTRRLRPVESSGPVRSSTGLP